MKKNYPKIFILILMLLIFLSIFCACKKERVTLSADPLSGDPYPIYNVEGKDLTNYVFPEGIEEIKHGEFLNTTGEIDLLIPASVKRIESLAFYNSEITSITFEDNKFLNLDYAWDAFKKCENLKKVTFKESAFIPDQMFMGCKNLESVEAPFFESIGNRAFFDCDNLQNFDFTKCFKIGEFAFNKILNLSLPSADEILNEFNNAKCDFIQLSYEEFLKKPSYNQKHAILFERNVSYNHCFQKNKILKSVIFPEDFTVINDNMFLDCNSLNSIIFKGKITFIGAFSFFNCTSLKQIDIGEDVKIIEIGAFAQSGLTEITLPEGLLEIQCSAFSNCENLDFLKLPSTVKEFGYHSPFNKEPIASKNTKIIIGDNPYWASYEKASEHNYE